LRLWQGLHSSRHNFLYRQRLHCASERGTGISLANALPLTPTPPTTALAAASGTCAHH
jgi:hypothetical protein